MATNFRCGHHHDVLARTSLHLLARDLKYRLTDTMARIIAPPTSSCSATCLRVPIASKTHLPRTKGDGCSINEYCPVTNTTYVSNTGNRVVPGVRKSPRSP